MMDLRDSDSMHCFFYSGPVYAYLVRISLKDIGVISENYFEREIPVFRSVHQVFLQYTFSLCAEIPDSFENLAFNETAEPASVYLSQEIDKSFVEFAFSIAFHEKDYDRVRFHWHSPDRMRVCFSRYHFRRAVRIYSLRPAYRNPQHLT